MRPLLLIFAYSGMDDMLDRHWSGYERSGCDILISSPVDASCRRGGLCYAHSQRYGQELLKRMLWTYRHVLKLGYDIYYFIEADSLVLRRPPKTLQDGLHAFLWDNYDTNFKGRRYAHWPHGMNRKTLVQLVAQFEKTPFLEQGWPDRAVGTLCENAGIAMHHRPDLAYSRNLLDRDEYFAEAQEAIDMGITFLHGVKTQQQLARLRLT